MGQCHPIPKNKLLRYHMTLHAKNYQRIYDMYNFDYDPEPQSDLYKAYQNEEKVTIILKLFFKLLYCIVTLYYVII